MSPRVSALLGAAVLVALAAFCALRFRTTNDLTRFLPEGADQRDARLSRALAEAELARTMILDVGAPDTRRAALAAGALARRLRGHPEVAWVRSGLDDDAQRGLYQLFFPQRFHFLSEDPERELPPRLTDAGLASAARALKRALVLPTAPLVARLAGADPLLAFSNHLERLRSAQGDQLRVVEGQFVTRDGLHGVIFLGTRHSPFDAARQGPLLDAIERHFLALDRGEGGALTLEQSGVHRFARASEALIRRDTERISTLSMVGVALVFLVLFRGLRAFLLASLALASGLLAGMAAALMVSGSLHGLTLAFGSSLIGVCIDFPEHYLVHHTLHPSPEGGPGTLRRIWKGLLLGALTSSAGLAAMAWTSLPGLREMAVFSSVGVLMALATTRWVLPALVPHAPVATPLQRRLVDAFGRWTDAVTRRPHAAWPFVLAALALTLVGLPRLRWVDDLSALTPQDPALLAEDARVRGRVAPSDGGRFVVVTGRTLEAALLANDRVAGALTEARTEGALEGFRSLHTVLWSPSLQRRNDAALRAAPDLAPRLSRAFEREGFRAAAFAPFAEALAAPPPPPLTFEALLASPLAHLVRPFRVRVGDDVGLLTLLHGVRDPRALQRRLAPIPTARYFDQQRFLRDTYGRYRRQTLQLTALGLVAVFALVFARYRDLRRSLAAFTPALLSTAAAMAVVALEGQPANLMHLIGLLLVLSMGVDYGVFMVETSEQPESLGATALGLVLAWSTTVLSFGLLGLSQNPALHAIGLTTGVGMTFSLLLAPLSLALFRAARPAP